MFLISSQENIVLQVCAIWPSQWQWLGKQILVTQQLKLSNSVSDTV